MDLKADINWIIRELTERNDPRLVKLLKNLIISQSEDENLDWWDEISVEEREQINAGLSQLKNDDIISHDQVVKDIRKWL